MVNPRVTVYTMLHCKSCEDQKENHIRLALYCGQKGIDIQEVVIGRIDGVTYYPLPEHDEALIKHRSRKTPSYILDVNGNLIILPLISTVGFDQFIEIIESHVQ